MNRKRGERQRVLVPTKVAAEVLEILRSYVGLEVEAHGELSAGEFAARLPQADGVIIRSNNRVTREMLEAAPRLRVIGRAGTGLDNVDLETATRRGVVVMNTPGVNSIATAEHTISMLMSLARKIPAADRSVKEGRWERSRYLGAEILGKVLGIIGLGRIGVQVAKRALGLGMEVIGCDPFLTADTIMDESIQLVSFDELLAQSDFITVHVPLTSATHHMIGHDAICKMRDGVRILNCARGGVVDEQALCDAIEAGKVAGAALDVYESEPPTGSRVTASEAIITTPHLGGSTREAQLNVGRAIARQVADFLTKGIIQNAVNAAPVTGETRALVGPVLDLCERIGSMAAQLAEGPADTVAITVHGERWSGDLKILSTAVLKGLLSMSLDGHGVNWVNAGALARERGIEVQVTEAAEREDFANLICVRVGSGSSVHEIWGTQLGKNDSRVVSIDGYPLEMKPQGAMLVAISQNVPGVVGLIGSVIGKHGGNINKMNNGCSPDRTRALSTISLDEEPPAAMLQELGDLPHFEWIRLVRL